MAADIRVAVAATEAAVVISRAVVSSLKQHARLVRCFTDLSLSKVTVEAVADTVTSRAATAGMGAVNPMAVGSPIRAEEIKATVASLAAVAAGTKTLTLTHYYTLADNGRETI